MFSIHLLIVGAIFFPFVFLVFSLTCYRVFFYFSLSGILLITLLCYVLCVNFVIVCYLAPIYYQFLRVFSVTAFIEVDYLFPRWPWPPTLLSSAFGKQLRFHHFSLISFCSRFKVVFLYCNYYFFALCRNLLFYGFVIVKLLLIVSSRVVFGIGPCPFTNVIVQIGKPWTPEIFQ